MEDQKNEFETPETAEEAKEAPVSEEAKEAQEAEAPVEQEQAAEQPAEQPAEGEAPKEEENPFLDYIRNAFAKEHIDKFMETLDEDQKSFVYVFCSGFETAIGRHIVGVYDSEYIEGFHFTKEVLDSLRIIVKPVEVKDSKLKFTVVAQLV